MKGGKIVETLPEALESVDPAGLREFVIPFKVFNDFQDMSVNSAWETKLAFSHSLVTAVIVKKMSRVFGFKELEDVLFQLGFLGSMDSALWEKTPRDAAVADASSAGEERRGKDIDAGLIRRLIRTWELPKEMIEAFDRSTNGQKTLKTKELIESSGRLADALVYCFVQQEQDKTVPLRFELLPLLGKDGLQELIGDLQVRLEIFANLLDLPKPDRKLVSKTLLRTVQDLSTANSRYERSDKALGFKIHQLETMTKVFTGIIKGLDGDPLTFSVLESIMEGFHAEGAFMLNREPGGGFAGYAAWSNPNGDAMIDYVHLTEDRLTSSLLKCIEKREPVMVEHPENEEYLVNHLGRVSKAWVAPACVRSRLVSLIGLGFNDAGGNDLSVEFRDMLDVLSGEIALALENTKLYDRMRKEAEMDPLTDISNRRCIFNVLRSEFARFKRKKVPLSVVIFDLDNFKLVNDQRGHLEGDALLKEVSGVLKDGIRDTDYIGRYGGDEFMAVFPRTEADETLLIADRIRGRIARCCVEVVGPDLGQMLTVSVGIAISNNDMERADDLVNAADDALYIAKGKGRNLCVVAGAEKGSAKA